MTYGHLQADCLYTGISSGPNARYRVWEAFTFTFTAALQMTFKDAHVHSQLVTLHRRKRLCILGPRGAILLLLLYKVEGVLVNQRLK